MPVEQYTGASGGASYTISYGEGWYIIERGGKVLKHVSTAAEMGLADNEASLALTRNTAVADIDNQRGVES
jgi:hypothetical protein